MLAQMRRDYPQAYQCARAIADYESPDRPAHSKLDAPKSYGLSLAHKHLPEMQKISGLANPPAFVPVVCDYYSGMQVLVPCQPVWGGAEKVAAGLAEYFRACTLMGAPHTLLVV